MSQLAIGEAPPATTCEWCREQPATRRIFATNACDGCVIGGRQHRVRVSLNRWGRGVERR